MAGIPVEREGEFVPHEQATEKGYWGTPVSEYPNERFTLNEIVKYNPGGYAGTEEEPQEDARKSSAGVDRDSSKDSPKARPASK